MACNKLVKELDAYPILMAFATRLRLSPLDAIVQRAIRLINKGVTLVHMLAGILLYTHLKDRGFQYISIEETVGSVKCDVYAKLNSIDICIEIETYAVPNEYVLEGYRYIIARHVKKVLQVLKEGIASISFAYPFGSIPLIPPVLLKPPESRAQVELENLLSISRKFYSLEYNDLNLLRRCVVEGVYLYDVATPKVSYLPSGQALKLVSSYIETLSHRADAHQYIASSYSD